MQPMLVCFFIREFQEAKNLTLLVALSKGTGAGAAIAMDDIKVIFYIKASSMCRWISQVQWLPVLAHEVSREVKHQQQLFPEVTETPEKESTGATEEQGSSEAPNMGQTDAANVTTVAPTEEASGSGDSGESEGSATEGSSESEEEVREKYLI